MDWDLIPREDIKQAIIRYSRTHYEINSCYRKTESQNINKVDFIFDIDTKKSCIESMKDITINRNKIK